MKLGQAIEIIKHYQKWRTGIEDDISYSSKELTEALDLIIDVAVAYQSGEIN